MFTALGVGGGGSLIGGVAILLAVIPFAFYRYGEGIRIKSKFSPTGPKKEHDESDDAEKGQVRGGDEGGITATSPDGSDSHLARDRASESKESV